MIYLQWFIFLGLLLINRWLFYAVIGILTAGLFYWDKRASVRKERRISVKTLLLYSLLGGAFGALITIFLIRHKSSKPEIYIPVIIFAGIHIVIWMLI